MGGIRTVIHAVALTAFIGGLASVSAFFGAKPVWEEFYKQENPPHEHHWRDCHLCSRIYESGVRDATPPVRPANNREAALRKELETIHKVLDRLHVEVR